jgi:hypothetical protein
MTNIQANHIYHAVELHSVPESVKDWLKQYMGVSDNRYFIRGTTIYFYTQADHLMFLMHWG